MSSSGETGGAAAGLFVCQLPGEIQFHRREERLRTGIPIDRETVSRLKDYARELGIAPLSAPT